MNEIACRKRLKSALHLMLLVSFLVGPFFSVTALAQQRTVTGKVINPEKQAVPSATVSVKGKSTVVTTDNDGNFSIEAAAGDVLVITSVGFADLEVPVGTDSNLNIELARSGKSMDEVIVVGYGAVARKNLTTSISKIDPKDVPQSGNSSVAQLVFGRAPGVQAVQNSAEPGGMVSVSIRGRGNPLVVIDGVVMPYAPLEPGNSGIANELNGVRRGGFAGLNPDDIESIEFLKDASAAIYGVNASNGVMLITTKKGKAGRLSVGYDGSRSFVRNSKYLEPLSARDYMTTWNRLSEDKYLFDNNMAPYGPNAATGFSPKFSQTDIQNAGEGTDWLGLVLRNGSIDNHNISISGGTDKITFYASGGIFNQEGSLRQSGLTRYTGRSVVTYKFTNWFSATANLSGSRANFMNSTAGWQNGNSGPQGFGALQAALAYPRTVPVYDNDGKYSLFQITANPVSMLDLKDKTAYNMLNVTLSTDFNIIGNELKARLLYGNNSENTTRDFFIPSTTFYFQMYRARGSWNYSNRQLKTMEATLMYNKSFFGGDLRLDAVGGYGEYHNESNGFGAASADMQDGIGTDNLFSGTGNVIVSSTRYYDKKRSYFGRASFDLFDKYIVQFTGRYDGYSQFFPQNKYAFFPSASLAWKISNESFLRDVEFINLLKLRGSIGVTGEASGFAYAAYGPDNTLVSFDNGSVQIIPNTLWQLDRPDLRWPKTVNKNIGLDFSIINDRISGSFDWFQDDITRLLNNNAPTAPLSFFATQPVNGAHRVRTGWEFALNTRNVTNKDFQWNTTVNLSHVLYKHKERFEFEVLPQGATMTDPVSSIYVFRTDGLLQVGEAVPDAQATLPARGRMPGNPKIVDLNGDKVLDSKDIVRYNAFPKVTVGFGNTFSYKQFDLAVFFYGQFGGYGWNTFRSWANPLNLLSGQQSGIKELNDVWSVSNPNGSIPGVAFDQAALGLPAGLDVDLAKTDFLRCRNINLAYNFNQKPVLRHFKSLKLYVDVQNAFIITNYKIADPEVQANGVKGGPAPYPMAVTYSIGVKANL